MNNRLRILFIAQFPPPVHGSAIISKIIAESKILNEAFDMRKLPLQFARTMKDLGSLSISKISTMIRVAFQINSAIRGFHPDLIYFTISPKGLSFYRDVFYVLILKWHGSRIVYHLHVKGLKKESERNFLKRRLYKYVFKNAHVITLSRYLLDDIAEFYAGTPFIVNNGVRPVAGDEAVLQKPRVPEKVQLLYLSNLMRAKGIFVLLEAVLWLKDKAENFTVRIIGNPADVSKAEIEEYIRKNNLSGIMTVEDGKYGDEKYEAFRAADIFLHPTLNDAFPLVILEAMQFQLPVISTYEGAIPEIVAEGITGYLVAKNEAINLAEKTLHLMQNVEERIAMGIAGRQRFLNNYTTERMERAVRNVFQCISEKSGKLSHTN